MKKLRVVWVDDERDPNKKMPFGMYSWWRHKTPYEFHKLCEDNEPEIVWLKSYIEWLKWCLKHWNKEEEKEYIDCYCLDHDLASYDACGNEKTGVNVAHDICDYCMENNLKLPFYECHSSNPYGKRNIESVFESFLKVYE